MSAKESLHISKDSYATTSHDLSLESTEISREINPSATVRENLHTPQDLSRTEFSFGVERKQEASLTPNSERAIKQNLKLDTKSFLSTDQENSRGNEVLSQLRQPSINIFQKRSSGMTIFDRFMRWVERIIKALEQKFMGRLTSRLRPQKLPKKVIVKSNVPTLEEEKVLEPKFQRKRKTLRL